jgi:hypothetical protein
MKKMIFITLGIFLASIAISQSENDYVEIMRSVLKTEKKAMIAEVMTLSDSEAEVF